jgi:hypothetical protein
MNQVQYYDMYHAIPCHANHGLQGTQENSIIVQATSCYRERLPLALFGVWPMQLFDAC